MLKRKALRNIIITSISSLIIIVICIIPNTNNIYLNPKVDVSYVTNQETRNVYLLNSNNMLVRTNILVLSNDISESIKKIIDTLKIDNNRIDSLRGLIPHNTKLLDYNVENKIVTLNFSKELLNSKDNNKMIEAIVYSLIDIDGIEKVIVKVEGNIYDKDYPLYDRNFGINKVYNMNTLNDTKKVIVFYTTNLDNNKYYVPVTNYINDNKESINIIIDNLKGTFLYDNSLDSLVSNNIELLDYNINNEIMTLNFNNNLLDNSRLLEEVTYPISESVFYNYDVRKIIYKVSDKEVFIEDRK